MMPFQQQQDGTFPNYANLQFGNFSHSQNLAGNLSFAPEFHALDQTDLGFVNPNNPNPNPNNQPSMMHPSGPAGFQQPSQAVFSPQTMLNSPMQNTALQAQFQPTRLYQGGDMGSMSPQTFLYQQQQAMAMRAKQSPNQSPALNNATFQNVANSPMMVNNSPSMGGYAVSSPMVASHTASPMSFANQSRVIPSQANNPYVQSNAFNIQPLMRHDQMGMPGMTSASPMTPGRKAPSYVTDMSQTGMEDLLQAPKPFSAALPTHVQSPMPGHSPSSGTHRSATPSSTTSTPMQQHRQLDQHQPQKQPATKRTRGRSPVSSETTAQSSPKITDKSSEKDEEPALVTYVPKTRNVETYGGIDLKYFDKFEIKPAIPHLGELGAVDIQALIMSLKSGMKMEVANALNVLTMLTVQQPSLPLQQCEDLLDLLLDILEKDFFGYSTRFKTPPDTTKPNLAGMDVDKEANYAELFDMSLDEMKSLIPELEDSTSEIWLSLRERCLCIFNLFRNFSFMSENIGFLSKHQRFVNTLARIASSPRENETHEAWFVGIRRMDTLDHRKTILIIFSNIAMMFSLDETTGPALVHLAHDFLLHGPETYYATLAIDLWAKIAVNYGNRKVLSQMVIQKDDGMFDLFVDLWAELSAVIRRDFFSVDGRVMFSLNSPQLATLEMAMMGLYNVMVIADDVSLRRRLIDNDKSVPMMILRLCIGLGESGNQHFGVVTKRGIEVVRGLVCGGDGMRRRPTVLDSEENEAPKTCLASGVLDMGVLREKLMLATVKSTTDPEILRELTDFVALVDEEMGL
ncbi:hypothetical protein CLU79DRAFT_754067 [Phycomyces nitens]|nr:hypothetical protein CLU79DRAFT_754067 [Phycomyces nitens]